MGPFGTMRQRGWVRPAIAVTLGLLATGLGHIYLRRWRRALVWIGAVLFISVFVIPPEAAASNLTVEAISAGDADLAVIAPIVGIGIASVADVYMLARNRAGHTGSADGGDLSLLRAAGGRRAGLLSVVHHRAARGVTARSLRAMGG
jgi:hypothetical protein